MPTLLPLLFAVAVLSPEPLTHQPPPDGLEVVNVAWWTHDTGFVPDALKPPPPKPATTSNPKNVKADSGMGSNVEQWRALVSQYFPGEVELALCVIAGESGGNPNAQNPTSSAAGLWQFLRRTWDRVPLSVTGGSYDSGAVFDPVAATRAAAWLRNADGGGWTQWNAYRRC